MTCYVLLFSTWVGQGVLRSLLLRLPPQATGGRRGHDRAGQVPELERAGGLLDGAWMAPGPPPSLASLVPHHRAQTRSSFSACLSLGGQAIAHFFSSPRVLSEGDIVPVPVPVRPLPTSMGPSDGEPPRPPGTASLPPPSSDDRDRSELALDLVELARSRSSQERRGEEGAGAANDVAARPGSRAGGAVTISRVSDLIYFKVTRLVSEATAGEEEGGAGAMVLSRTDSTLMQAGALQASVPDPAACHAFQCRCIDLSLPPASSPPCILRLHAPPPPPPTDPQALQSLLRLLLPVMYQPSATPLLTRTAILVHGPAGIGKGGLIRAAAHRLGCHVREVRTRTLLRPTDVTTMAAFRAALDGARDVGPCVLHLVNVKAAYNVSSRRHGGGEPGLEGRLAAALALCLEELGRGGGGQRQPAQHEAGEQRPANGRAGFRGVIVVGSCDGVEDLAEPIRRCFSHELAIGYPDVDLRLQVRGEGGGHHTGSIGAGEAGRVLTRAGCDG